MKKQSLVPAAAYYRMSSGKQEKSIPAQRTEVERMARELGYRIAVVYIDEGISGDATEKRTDFLRMREDAAAGKFEVVLAWDQDRFGRFDEIDAGYWIKPFRDAGVRLVTVAQGVIDWEDALVFIVNQRAKNAYLKDLSRNVLRGQIRAAAEGRGCGGPAPYGYRWQASRLVVVPEEAEVVRWIFDMYGNHDYSLRGIALALNKRGVKSSTGGKWQASSLGVILRNRKYTGVGLWNQQHVGKYHKVADRQIAVNGRGEGAFKNPESEWIIIPNNHESLVDPETFERVSRRLEARKGTKRPSDHVFAFTGLLTCAECGGPMNGHTRRLKDGTPRRLYLCTKYLREGRAGCNHNTVDERRLTACVVRKLQEQFLNRDNLEKLRAEIKLQLKREHDTSPARLKRLRRKLTEMDCKIEQAKKRLVEVDADLLDVVQDQLRGLRSERSTIAADLEAATRPVDASGRNMEEMVDIAVDALLDLDRRLDEVEPGELREIIDELVTSVELTFSHEEQPKYTRSRFSRGVIRLRRDSELFYLVQHAQPL